MAHKTQDPKHGLERYAKRRMPSVEESKVRDSSQAARIDLKDKVIGAAQYIEDLPDLPNTAYGATLLSPYSHARILSIDSSDALKVPGVLGVVDREHLDGINPRLKVAPHEHFKLTDDQEFVAIDQVRFDGDLVAVLVAEDLRTAQRARKKSTLSMNRCRQYSTRSKRWRPEPLSCMKSVALISC